MATVPKIPIDSENEKGAIPAVQFGDPKSQKFGVVVLQEWWGMNQQVIDVAKSFSERGNFTTIVPDLYRGKLTEDHEEAGHLMSGLDWKGAVKDIQGCARYLIKEGCSKVGVMGFCMGGALSIASAALVPEISASAPFYGIPTADLCDVTCIKIPLQCHFGAEDAIEGFSSPKDQKLFREKLDGAGVKYEFFSYPAAHAFANNGSPNYKPSEAETALGRVSDFFKANLA